MLTREQIYRLEPGRQMDEAVAELVMGLKPGEDFGPKPDHQWKPDEDGEVDLLAWDDDWAGSGPWCTRCHESPKFEVVPGPCDVAPARYSLMPSHALDVAERLRQTGWLVAIKLMPDRFPFLQGDDWVSDPKLVTPYLVALDWMGEHPPHGTVEDSRKRIRRTRWYRPWAHAETLPVAVCRAGLLANVGDLVDPPEGWSVLDPEASRG